MSDKSPRQSMSKKPVQTIKQKRAAKRAETDHATAPADLPKAKRR